MHRQAEYLPARLFRFRDVSVVVAERLKYRLLMKTFRIVDPHRYPSLFHPGGNVIPSLFIDTNRVLGIDMGIPLGRDGCHHMILQQAFISVARSEERRVGNE